MKNINSNRRINKKINILICGIGGQGAVFFGNFLRNYFHQIGIPKAKFLQDSELKQRKKNNNQIQKKDDDFIIPIISGTESRGVSQREGSVIATIKLILPEINQNDPSNYDKNKGFMLSPNIPPYSADIVYALEPLELLRNIKYIHPRSIIFLNRHVILPKNIITEQVELRRKERIGKLDSHRKNEGQKFLSPEKIMEDLNSLLRSMYSSVSEPINMDDPSKETDKQTQNENHINISEIIDNKQISIQDFHYMLKTTISKNEFLKNNMLSKFPNLIDLDITNELISRDLGTLTPNFILLGMSINILKEIFDKDKITEFFSIFFKEKSSKIIELNKNSLDFGFNLMR